MKTNKLNFICFFVIAFALPFAVFGQYPNAPNKIGLGRQTTGDGLIFRTSSKPNWTPSSAFNAWMALDTTSGNLWTFRENEWFLEVAGDLNTVYPLVINKSGVAIERGQVVMVDTVQIVQGDQVRIRPAIATVSNSQLIMGVASANIPNDSSGYVTWFGYVREVDHDDIAQSGDTLNVGDILYISATQAGKFTDVEPSAPNVNSTMALVVRKPNANNMTLLVRPWLNEKLGDLRDVDLAGLGVGDGIKWDGTKWIAGQFAGTDSTIVSAGYGIDVSEVSNNFTVSADTSELATPYDVSLKQDKLTGTGLVKSTSGTISYITDSSTNWDAAYNDKINSAAFTGTNTKTLTLTQQDAGTVTASFTDLQGVTSVAAGVGLSGGTITTTGTISADTTILATKWFAADTAYGVREWVEAQGYTSNTGTVTSIATNNGITGGTITTTGTIGLTGQALALHNLSSNGLIARTGAGAISARTITAGTGISVTNGDGVSGNPTITNSAPDQTVVLTAGTGIGTSGTYPNFTITNSAPDQTVSITGAGINAVTGTYPTFTITATEVDGSVTNEGVLGVGAGSGTTAVITSNTSGANGVTISAGTGIGVTETTSTNGGTITITNSAPDQTVSITGAGINAVTGTYPNFTITGNEVDGSVTNELQNLSLSGQSLGISSGSGVTLPIIDVSAGTGISVSKVSGNATITNSAPDQTVSITGAGINAVTGTYPNFTVTGTEVDGSVSNEGTLGVSAGGANTSVITSNTSGATGVTIAGGTNVTITESTASNGGTITINASGGGGGVYANIIDYGASPIFQVNTLQFDSIYFGFNISDPSQGIIIGVDTFDYATAKALFLNINVSSNIPRRTELADSTAALRAAFPNTIYNNNGTLTGARTVSTNGNKLTITGSNSAEVLEVNNTNTGTSTNALTLQAYGPPLQATRLTSSTGSILPISDYFVNTSGTAAVGLGGFHRFYVEDAGGLNKEAGRIGFRTSDATGSSYDSEAFISVRKDSSELKEGLTLLSTGQLQLKEYGDTLFTGTAVKHLAVDNDGKVIEVDWSNGTVKGTGAANKVAIWASADSLIQNTNLHWDNTNGRLGVNNTSPSERIHVGGNVRAERLIVNTTGQNSQISNFKPSNAVGENFYIGGGGENSTAHPDTTFQASYNTGIGLNSLFYNTTGFSNTAIGGYSLYLNTRGAANTAIGGSALILNTTGNENLAIANNAIYSNTSGSQNMGIGTFSLYNNTTASYNMALGTYGLYSNTTGATNVGIGAFSLFSNTTANKNIGIGQGALFYVNTGGNNTAIGADTGALTNSGANNTSLSNSVLIGQDTRPSASGNTNEIVIGYQGRGQGSNTAIIGNSSITNTYLRGKVSVNTTASANTLDVEGGAAIGATYSGTNTAPTNGLLVEGVFGLGTNILHPGFQMHMYGRKKSELIEINNATTDKGHRYDNSQTFTTLNTTFNNRFNSTLNGIFIGGNSTVKVNNFGDIIQTSYSLSDTANLIYGTNLSVKSKFTRENSNNGLVNKLRYISLDTLDTQGSGTPNINIKRFEGLAIENLTTAPSGITTDTVIGIYIAQQKGGSTSSAYSIYSEGGSMYHVGSIRTDGTLSRSTFQTVTGATANVGSNATWVICNRAGTINLTLPSASANTGRELTIKTITANAVNSAVGVNNVVPIDSDVAGNTILPATDGAWALLVSNGTNWVIMQRG